ncbi:hypothetical protein HY993_04520 [Candidatus Micrarchaeota archaeon]|nr:hypothetical protein [Candidatus Micrarchaeota archaeon]
MAEVYGRQICEKSFKEMARFVFYANSIGEIPLVFGGWAVYHYNPYAGSRDVDFVVADDRFDPLVDFLAGEGYSQKEARLFKDGIFFDLYKQSEDIGSEENKLQFSQLYKDAQRVYLKRYGTTGASGEVMIPAISNLLFFKLHALANRSVPKDKSDAIALLLKASEDELKQLRQMLSPHLKTRLQVLRNDGQNLALAALPTQRNLNLLNKKIKEAIN